MTIHFGIRRKILLCFLKIITQKYVPINLFSPVEKVIRASLVSVEKFALGVIKMRKIVAIAGSCNSDSLTAQIINRIFRQIGREQNYTYEIIDLSKCKIEYCISCNECFTKEACPLDKVDDFGRIRKELLSADIVVYGSPVYAHNISGIMKSVFDRLSLSCHTLDMAGTLGIALSTTRSSGGEKVADIIKSFQTATGIKNVADQK